MEAADLIGVRAASCIPAGAGRRGRQADRQHEGSLDAQAERRLCGQAYAVIATTQCRPIVIAVIRRNFQDEKTVATEPEPVPKFTGFAGARGQGYEPNQGEEAKEPRLNAAGL